ncbi:hypothetical protein F503_08092 [Ophiostoma piceae UAMH 11346]|uniref:Ubiquitin-like domain-containing protein n=1 Tax=Ophiostoma piceae (strain UAMH 11346) TaxID=1262450 RepID=S3C6C8_OPHP1|nr:hypothetical protein F503_08092 [Ophiostoma piceae UAMH 11346]
MTEVQFAKSFLGALDGRPIKLSADYAEDARRYPARSPQQYTLPSMKKAMRKTTGSSTAKTAAPGSAPAITVTVKSMHRNPPLDVRLASGDYTLTTTSILDIRTALAEQTGVPLAKLKLLHNKKPVSDSKVLQDVAADGEATKEIELGVMVSGGAATVAAAQKEKEEAAAAASASAPEPAEPVAAAAPSTSAAESKPAADTEEFWTDLRGFLLQRTKDAKHADELFSLFTRAYDDRMI